MLKERLAQEDCNAGAIFDCLRSEFWKDDKKAIEIICEAVPAQSLQLMLLKFQRTPEATEGEEEPDQVCTNYRYARRKAAKAKGGKEGAKVQDEEQIVSRQRQRKPKPGQKDKKGKKEEEEKQTQE